jgi:hypothetical protein
MEMKGYEPGEGLNYFMFTVFSFRVDHPPTIFRTFSASLTLLGITRGMRWRVLELEPGAWCHCCASQM